MRIFRIAPALIAALILFAVPAPSLAQFSIGVGFTVGAPPPPLPVYVQPAAPYPNYQWTPGYWGWGAAGYYWVPGVWVAPPAVGLYWTPGYWGYGGGGYGWSAGYWGASVGFYGGVNYGFGYPGTGFYGGAWGPRGFAYNTAVVNVNRTVIHNTYINKTVINKYNTNNHVSYNGGHGGISARPTAAQVDARRAGRAPTTAQRDTARISGQDRRQYAVANHGKPADTASAKALSDQNKPSGMAPVTAADKQAAQKQYHAGTGAQAAGQSKASQNNSMQSASKNTTQAKPAPKSQSGKAAPPHAASQPSHHTGNTMQSSHPQNGGKPPSGGQGKPPAHNSSGGKPPQNGGKPQQSGGNKPPQGNNNGGKPPQGGDQNKPPHR